jgi:hypothetical protein
MPVMGCLVPIQQIRTIEALCATTAFVRSRILVTFEMTIEMVCALVGARA